MDELHKLHEEALQDNSALELTLDSLKKDHDEIRQDNERLMMEIAQLQDEKEQVALTTWKKLYMLADL